MGRRGRGPMGCGYRAMEQLEQHDSQREDVRAHPIGLTIHNLRRRVGRSAHARRESRRIVGVVGRTFASLLPLLAWTAARALRVGVVARSPVDDLCQREVG